MPAPRPAAPRSTTIPRSGGFTFAEAPTTTCPDARIIWRAELDPETLSADAVPIARGDPDRIDAERLKPFLACARDRDGHEHVVLSDGWHRIRLDIDAGSLMTGDPVTLRYELVGVDSAVRKAMPLLRFLELCRRGTFALALFPSERRAERWIVLLRVHDALMAGASQREIASVLFGAERVARDWDGASESLRARIRRLVRDARRMASGGYRSLLRERVRLSVANRRVPVERSASDRAGTGRLDGR